MAGQGTPELRDAPVPSDGALSDPPVLSASPLVTDGSGSIPSQRSTSQGSPVSRVAAGSPHLIRSPAAPPLDAPVVNPLQPQHLSTVAPLRRLSTQAGPLPLGADMLLGGQGHLPERAASPGGRDSRVPQHRAALGRQGPCRSRRSIHRTSPTSSLASLSTHNTLTLQPGGSIVDPQSPFMDRVPTIHAIPSSPKASPSSPKGPRQGPRAQFSSRPSGVGALQGQLPADQQSRRPTTHRASLFSGEESVWGGGGQSEEYMQSSSLLLMRELQNLQDDGLSIPMNPITPSLKHCRVATPTQNPPESWAGIPQTPSSGLPHLMPQPPVAPAHETLGPPRSRPPEGACQRLQLSCQHALTTNVYKVVLSLATFHLLFVNDLYYIVLPMEADTPAQWATLATALLLLAEFAASCIAWREEYVISPVFWLDLVALGSVVPDILVLAGALGPGATGPNLALARIGRAARVGTRLGRLGRMTKWAERMLLCCRRAGGRRVTDFELDDEDPYQVRQSEVGKSVKRKLTSKNSAFMLLIFMGAIVLSPAITSDPDDPHWVGLRMYLRHDPSSPAGAEALAELVDTLEGRVLRVEVGRETTFSSGERFADMRELDVSSSCTTVQGRVGCVWVSVEDDNYDAAVLSVCLTLFAMALIVAFNAIIIHDVQTVLVSPIERMVGLVEAFIANPLAKFCWRADEERGEMGLLIRAIKKLGALIQVGFGEAGAEVVSKNLQHGALFTMLPGRNVLAIFSFCDIRNFTQATEALRQDVMFFVNSVAQIVHKTVSECGGSPNKNIGDAFLSVWRLGEARFEDADLLHAGDLDECSLPTGGEQPDNGGLPPHGSGQYNGHLSSTPTVEAAVVTTDSGLVSGTMRSSDFPVLFSPASTQDQQTQAENALAYALLVRERIQGDRIVRTITEKVGNEYKCNLGHGLHYGWAVEGAIGSERKIDASYLSPHVNVTARLEAATKQYGTAVLLSAEFYEKLSPYTRQHYTRPIDCVLLKGTKDPRVIYSGEPLSAEEVQIRLSFEVDNEGELAAQAARRTFRRSSVRLDGSGMPTQCESAWAEEQGQSQRCSSSEQTVTKESITGPHPSASSGVRGVDFPLSDLLPSLPKRRDSRGSAYSTDSSGPMALRDPSVSEPPSRLQSSPFHSAAFSGGTSDTQAKVAVQRVHDQLLGDRTFSVLDEPRDEDSVSCPVYNASLEGATRVRIDSDITGRSSDSPRHVPKDPWRRAQPFVSRLSLHRISSLAVHYYIVGQWDRAAELLHGLQLVWPSDKPSKVLLNSMRDTWYVPPAEWPGYRVLSEK